jgi:hypothetical protein
MIGVKEASEQILEYDYCDTELAVEPTDLGLFLAFLDHECINSIGEEIALLLKVTSARVNLPLDNNLRHRVYDNMGNRDF